jgi:glycosyltransferase involved in cell wall biosynthesis
MRILHLGDEPWDSGLTEYSLLLAHAQQKASKQVLYLARKGSYAEKRARELGLQVETFSNPWLELLSLRRRIKQFFPDIINAHTGSSHTAAVALNSLLPKKAAVVRTRADARPLRINSSAAPLWNRTAGFMAANSAILEDFRRLSKSGTESMLVQQGIEGAEFARNPEKGLNVFRVAIVARLDPVKGHAVALEVFARLARNFPQARLVIAGEDRNVSAAQLQARASELGITGSVEFCGRLSDLYDFMRGCDVGIVPSLGSEAVSRVALEWSSCGVPVIASKIGGLPDLVKDGENGLLVPPGDADALYAALEKLAGDPALAARLGANGREFYLQRHTPQAFERNASVLYEKAICNISH